MFGAEHVVAGEVEADGGHEKHLVLVGHVVAY